MISIFFFPLHLAVYFLDLPVTNFVILGYILSLIENTKMLAFAHFWHKSKL